MTAVVGYKRVAEAGRAHAVITLDSDRNRNALSAQLLDELRSALHRAAADDVLAVLLRAEGRAFCSGADLSEAHREGIELSAQRLASLLRDILAHPLPVLVRIHGAVRAGGLGIVAACDIAVASDEVTYGFTEARLGLAPAVISLSVLPRMSSRVASTALLTAGTFGSELALEGGLISHTVPRARLDATVNDLVTEITACERQGLEATKRLLNAAALMQFDDRVDDLIAWSADLFASPVARRHLARFADGDPDSPSPLPQA